MTYKLSDYETRWPDVLNILQGDFDNISMASVASGVPVLVVSHIFGIAFGYSSQVNQLIANLMKFYDNPTIDLGELKVN